MKIVGEVIIAGRGLRTDFESASRIKIAPSTPFPITGSFGLKPMCNDAPRENVAGFCRYRLLSTPEQRLGSASILERSESGIPVSRKA